MPDTFLLVLALGGVAAVLVCGLVALDRMVRAARRQLPAPG